MRLFFRAWSLLGRFEGFLPILAHFGVDFDPKIGQKPVFWSILTEIRVFDPLWTRQIAFLAIFDDFSTGHKGEIRSKNTQNRVFGRF